MTLSSMIENILKSPGAEAHYREHVGGSVRCDAVDGSKSHQKGTWQDAITLHKSAQFRLTKYGGTQEERALRNTLRRCKSGNRCASAACPLCTYAVQGVMATLHRDLREGNIRFDRCITIIPLLFIASNETADRGVRAGIGKVARIRKRLDDAFDVSGITVVLGALDFDHQEFPNDPFKPHCRPHFHGLAFGSQADPGEKILRGEFPRRGSVIDSVNLIPYDGHDKWCRYMFKFPNSRKIRSRGAEGKWADSKYKPVTVQQHLQQLLILHEIGWSGRLYLRGIALIEGQSGNWRLVVEEPLNPPTRLKRRGRY